MIHRMGLKDDQLEKMRAGLKEIELRLRDKKRQALKPGDVIIFTGLIFREQLRVRLKAIKAYRDFYELYEDYDAISLGYDPGQAKDPQDMYRIYSRDSIENYGVLALEVELVE